jgi:hypothetical protein
MYEETRVSPSYKWLLRVGNILTINEIGVCPSELPRYRQDESKWITDTCSKIFSIAKIEYEQFSQPRIFLPLPRSGKFALRSIVTYLSLKIWTQGKSTKTWTTLLEQIVLTAQLSRSIWGKKFLEINAWHGFRGENRRGKFYWWSNSWGLWGMPFFLTPPDCQKNNHSNQYGSISFD